MISVDGNVDDDDDDNNVKICSVTYLSLILIKSNI